MTRATIRCGPTAAIRRAPLAVAALALVAELTGCAARAPGEATEPQYVPGSDYHLMMAEIATQRGAYPTAVEEYLQAAERTEDDAVARRATEFALDFGFDAFALRAARRWVTVAPDDRLAHRSLARLLLGRDDVDAAAEQAALALGPAEARNDDDYLALAGELGAADNPRGSTRVLTRLRAVSPHSYSLDMAVAASALASGDNDLALDAATGAAAGPSPIAADALAARALTANGDKAAGVERLARDLGPAAGPELRMEYARLLAVADRQSEALQELGQLAERYPNSPDIARLRGLISLDAGDLKTSWEQFGSLLAAGRLVPESLFYLGQIAERQVAYDDALRFYGRVGEGPQLIPALAAMIRIAERNGDTTTAVQLLDEFARDHPRYWLDSLRLRAGLLDRSNHPEAALASLNDALGFRPDDEGLRLARGEILQRMGRLDLALADLNAAVAAAPDSALALNALGYTLANRTGRHAEAYQIFAARWSSTAATRRSSIVSAGCISGRGNCRRRRATCAPPTRCSLIRKSRPTWAK